MDGTVAVSWNVCCTCEYWTGPRDVDMPLHPMTVSFNKGQYKCMKRPAWTMVPLAQCSDYCKWGVISDSPYV